MSDENEIFVDGYRKVHGKQADTHVGAVVETPPVDELRPGIAAPAPSPAPTGPDERRTNGTMTPVGARKLSALAAEARKRKRSWNAGLVSALRIAAAKDGRDGKMSVFFVRDDVRPFVDEADRAFVAKIEELARDVGGGQLGVGVISLVRTWTHQTYASRALFEMAMGALYFVPGAPAGTVNTALLATASKLGDAARNSLHSAHHLARLEAQARTEHQDTNELPPGWVEDT